MYMYKKSEKILLLCINIMLQKMQQLRTRMHNIYQQDYMNGSNHSYFMHCVCIDKSFGFKTITYKCTGYKY